jgi:hypothetical protein
MGGRDDRVRESQQEFRRANDEIATHARKLDTDALAPFLCECADERCTQIVELTLEEYEDVRSDDGRSLMAPGHAVADDERVLEESERYWITEKNGSDSARHTSSSV